MISLDTNWLVRILIDDKSLEQTKAARKLAAKEKHVFIPQIVQVELVWVLERAYGLKKQYIVSILSELNDNAAFLLQRAQTFKEALALFRQHNVDFSDCVIFTETLSEGHQPVVTFDKKFAKLKNVKSIAI